MENEIEWNFYVHPLKYIIIDYNDKKFIFHLSMLPENFWHKHITMQKIKHPNIYHDKGIIIMEMFRVVAENQMNIEFAKYLSSFFPDKIHFVNWLPHRNGFCIDDWKCESECFTGLHSILCSNDEKLRYYLEFCGRKYELRCFN